ncbi:glycosyltransferase [Paraburkholderia sp. BCC1886]|uniref:glycosyltransferase family protein n=1 Tax=Paraburkholderia sp. BCC1886 TaxID=2562670 RepID=UPI001182266A|nr:glycosyltransferase [Paraburkholderia sp. BCC1886]
MSLKNNTSLALGNFSMRAGDFADAIKHYIDVVTRTPILGRSIAANLVLAKKRYRSTRVDAEAKTVGVCSWDLSHNCAGRAYTLAMIYREFANVELIGSIFPQFGRDIWEPIRNASIPMHSFVVEDDSHFMEQAIELVAAHPYDIVHLSKPRAPNILIGFLYKLIWDSVVFVDIDDEELAFVNADSAVSLEDYRAQLLELPPLDNLIGRDWTRLAVGLSGAFDGVTVANAALQQLYGGDIVRHARDEKLFNPSLDQKRESREKYGIDVNKKVILFFGTPREHKGLIETATAVAALKRDDVQFVIVGDFANHVFKTKLQQVKGCDFFFVGNQPFDKLAEVVAIADCVVLLQNDELEAKYQVPAKLTDALAMGVPVICSATPGTADLQCESLIFLTDKEQLVEALRECLSLKELVSLAMSGDLRAFFTKNLSIASQIAILQKLCAGRLEPKNVITDARVLANALPSLGILSVLTSISSNEPEKGATASSLWRGRASGDAHSKSQVESRSTFDEKCDLGIIVLNLNGAVLLDRLFESLHRNRPNLSFRILVTDHASTDDSRAVLERWSRHLPIEVNYALENHTFSFSNNRWAERLVGCEKLLFLNNDIVFERNVLDQMAHVLTDPSVGVVGIDQWEPTDENGERQWHHCGIGFKWDAQYRFWRPFNMRHPEGPNQALTRAVPAVTGSVMMVRRREFLALEGFDEGYNYGYEDVDLCFSFKQKLRLKSVCVTSSDVIHADGVTRKKTPGGELKQQRLGNIERLRKKYTGHITRMQRQLLLGVQPLSQVAPRVAFAVTEVGKHASAGDLFTAMELGQSFESEFGWHVEYRPRGEQWYSLENIDIVIAMVDVYDPRRIRDAHPGLVKVAWARNWFERWCDREWHDEYDVYFASSGRGADYFAQRLGQVPRVLRIATNPERFNTDLRSPESSEDFVFTGSYWNVERQIVSALSALPDTVNGAIYGKNWEKVPQLAGLSKGFLPYDELPEVYRNAKIAIDDANHVTKPWGSVNSRVFDALAAGCLVVTNSRSASDDVFNGELPVYETPEDLAELIIVYSTDEAKRMTLVDKLRRRVIDEHTYMQRAYEFREHLRDHLSGALRFSVKIPVPKREQAAEWGDYHFAASLARELRAYGHRARIDFLPDWERGDAEGDDVTLVLRGLSEYKVKPGQCNLVWLISHPEKVGDEELNSYDRVFVASHRYARHLASRLRVPVDVLLQCTDDRKFNLRAAAGLDAPATEVLFVGNSRNQFRKIVRDALSIGISPDIYGTRWENFVPAEIIKGTNVPNNELPSYYAKAGVVLNDHWSDMAAHGFLSNRLFDAVACGANVISDRCEGIEEVFGDSVAIYESAAELAGLVEGVGQKRGEHSRARASAKVVDANSFRVRAKEILSFLDLN